MTPRESDRLDRLLDDVHVYRPRGNCKRVQYAEEPQIVLDGPAGTGKSRSCMEKLRRCAESYSGFRGLIMRKTRTSLTDTGLVTFERDVLGLTHPLVANGPVRMYRHSYVFDGNSEIVIAGMDKPGNVLSSEWDMIFVQQAEELTENDWEILDTRLRNNAMPHQQLLGDCNPGAPSHWIKQREKSKLTVLWPTRHEDNPILWRIDACGHGEWTERGKKYIARLDALTGVRKARLRHGRWMQAEGAVYQNYDAAVHLIDRFEIPEDWWRFRVVDFGYTNPFVCQWWAVDGDGRMYRYREIYMTKQTVKVHAGVIKAHSEGESIRTTVCDHDAEDMATLRENGIPTVRATKDVIRGIQAVIERLKVAGDGKPRIYFLRDSTVQIDGELVEAKKPLATEQEFDGYVWSNRKTKEEPVKMNDHGIDTTRYAVMYLEIPMGIEYARSPYGRL